MGFCRSARTSRGAGSPASAALFVHLSSRFQRAAENGFAADDGPTLETGAVPDSATDQGAPEVLEKTALPFGLVFLAAARRKPSLSYLHFSASLH